MKRLLLLCAFLALGCLALAGHGGASQALAGHGGVSLTSTSSCLVVQASTTDYAAMAHNAACRAGIDPGYFVAQMQTESNLNPDAYGASGEVGIAQFMPATAAGLGINPANPDEALNGAANLIHSYLTTYAGKPPYLCDAYARALAGYNAGARRLSWALAQGGTNWRAWVPVSTQHYIAQILGRCTP